METPQQDPATEGAGTSLSVISPEIMTKLKHQQDLKFAIIGGTSAAIVGALLWAVITVLTKYQIGYMAIGVGLLVGLGVRYFGMGVDNLYGIIGGVFALIGCALGNLLSQIGFAAHSQSLTYMDIVSILNLDLIIQLFQDSFSPMDVLFYGIAIYEGYKFSFRTFTDELIRDLAEGKLPVSPFEKYRLAIASTLFLGLLILSYFITSSNSGKRDFYYESGAKRSSGEVSGGRENGPWEYYYENGKLMSKGNFIDGLQEGTWEFFGESGVRYRVASFSKNIEHGEWTDYYSNGKVSSQGSYTNGRESGPWTFYYENGNVMRKGEMKMSRMHGPWEMYHENGKLGSQVIYANEKLTGNANFWYDDGTKAKEALYEDGIELIINSWDSVGKPQIVNGNGKYVEYYDDGSISKGGQYQDRQKVGRWSSFFPNGKVQETGVYRKGVYFLEQSWSPSGTQDVKNGEGGYKLYADTLLLESGRIEGGLRAGVWTKYNPADGAVWSKETYVAGKREGQSTMFFSGGKIAVEGPMKADQYDGEWIWYYENGYTETRVMFRDGVKVGNQTFYTEDGDPIRTEQYKDGECVNVVIGEELD